MVNQSPAVYLLVGPEKYLKEKTINDLRSSLLDGLSGELDYKVLHGLDTNAEEILSSVSTIPFFSSKRVVVIKEFEKLGKEDHDRIINYIKNPNQYICLVIDTDDMSILKDSPSLVKYAKVIKFSDPAGNEVSSWISKFINSKGYDIEEAAIDMLRELKGHDLLDLSQELEKLITYVGKNKKITARDVENIVGKSTIASAFDIAHAAAGMDASKAISIVYELVSSGKKPYEIIGLLAWHFKILLKIKTSLMAGETEYSIMQSLRLPRRSMEDFFAQSAAYSCEDIGSKLQILLDADLGIKRARYSPSMVLEFTVIRLCLAL